MRALVIVGVVLAASTAAAAPWSFEMPPAFTERAGLVDDLVTKLKNQPGTKTIVAQAFVADDGSVQLTRITWTFKMPSETSKRSLDAFEWGVTQGAAKEAQKHISDSRHSDRYQLIGEAVDESNGIEIHHRRIYAIDGDGVVTLFWTMCAGSADAVGVCTRAQQTMALSLPAAVEIPDAGDAKDLAYLIGKIAGGVLVGLLIVWALRRRNQS